MTMASKSSSAGVPDSSAPFLLSQHLHDGKSHLLLCASGSVATIKIPNIIFSLAHHSNLSIRLVLTSSATRFLAGQADEQPSLEAIRALPNVDGIYVDEDEWAEPWVRGGKILHIELRRWADVMVIAPLSANTLAKMVGGLCDNLLLSTIRAWDTTGLIDGIRVTRSEQDGSGSVDGEEEMVAGAAQEQADGFAASVSRKKIILVAPAMNTAMWSHPITKQHMKLLEGDWNVMNDGWIQVMRPVEKELACGDTGSGAMVEWRNIVSTTEDLLGL